MEQPVFEKIYLKTASKTHVIQLRAECKTDLNNDGSVKVVHLSAFPVLSVAELSDGKLRFSGKVTFFAFCQGENGELKKVERGTEFSGDILGDDLKAEGTVISSVKCLKSEVSYDGTKLSFAATLEISATATYNRTEDALISCEDLIIKEEEREIIKSLGVKKGNYPVEDGFTVNYPVAEVLMQRAEVTVSSVTPAVGCIIVEGETLVSAILLQNGDKSNIIREDRNIPFRIEADFEEAMPSAIATARATVNSLKTDITVDEEKGVSDISFSVSLFIETEASYRDRLKIAEDVFSLTKEITFEKCKETLPKLIETFSFPLNISGVTVDGDMPENYNVITILSEKAEVVAVEGNTEGSTENNGDISENSVSVTGVLSAEILLESENKLSAHRVETPFTVTVTPPDVKFSGKICAVKITPKKPTVKINGKGEIELSCEAVCSLDSAAETDIEFIKSVEDAGDKKAVNDAVSVYIAGEGEDLWSLSKRLSVCPSSVALTNPELQFPLTGEERIIIYRQL